MANTENYGQVKRLGKVSMVLMDTHGQVTDTVVQLDRPRRRNIIVPFSWVQDADEKGVYLSGDKNALENLPVYRSDDDLAVAVEDALWSDEILRDTDYHDIGILVQDGILSLRGHVTTLDHKCRAAAAVRSIPGILGLENNLVVDRDLVLAVVRAIQCSELTRDAIVSVSARHGFITLTGHVSNAFIQEAAGVVAASVAQVRGVANCLQAPGGVVNSDEPVFRQPPVGEDVYAADMLLGSVKQVVINPLNRCVTAFVTHADFSDLKSAGETGPSDVVFPIRAVSYEGDGLIRLGMSGAEAAQQHNFLPSDFVSPPADWQPPYPYRPEDVLFSKKELEVVQSYASDDYSSCRWF